MPAPTIVRPTLSPGDARWDELEDYLVEHFRRAKEAREEHLGKSHAKWNSAYKAEAVEKVRTTPFYNASNIVVPLIRIFIDTFVARTLNIIFATNPLIVVEGFPNDQREAGESYLDRKAKREWRFYELCRDMMFRGNKYGTAIVKIPWLEREREIVTSWEQGEPVSEPVPIYSGPMPMSVPFEDFYGYPITANAIDQFEIKFHIIRYTEEHAKRMVLDPENPWRLSEQDLESSLMMPRDMKKARQQQEAGVADYHYREFQAVECYLEYPLTSDPSRLYPIVATLQPDTGRLMDIYFDPTPPGVELFVDYRPFPDDDLFWGDSMAKLLAQGQEEVSKIHNERRDNNSIANGPQFKKKAGVRSPGPSTHSYPGKVWEVDEMDDFDVVQFGRAINETITEEVNAYGLYERLVGVSGPMQGAAQGGSNKRGIYGTGGTMAVMSEQNTRQNTNIRDVRQVAGRIAKSCFGMQRVWGPDDPTIAMFDDGIAEKIRAFFASATPDRMARSAFEIKASDPGANKEVSRANLLQMASILSQYSQQTMALAQQVQTMKNPLMQKLIPAILKMQREMAVSLAKEFDQLHLEGKLPDVERLLRESQQPAPPAPNGGGMGPIGGPGFMQGMAGLAPVPGQFQ